MQGFKTLEEARADARTAWNGLEYALLKRSAPDPLSDEGDYAWVSPVSYADKLVASGLAEKLGVEINA